MSEILGTLFKYLLALLAITAVVAVLYEALGTNKVATAVSDLTGLQADIAQLYAGSGNTAGITGGSIAQAAAAPASMISGTGTNATLVDPWGLTIIVAPVSITLPLTTAPSGSSSDTTSNGVSVQLQSVPTGACNKLATALLPSMSGISIGNTLITSTTSDLVTAISNDCAGSTAVQMTFYFTVS